MASPGGAAAALADGKDRQSHTGSTAQKSLRLDLKHTGPNPALHGQTPHVHGDLLRLACAILGNASCALVLGWYLQPGCMEKPDSRQMLGREWRRLGEAAGSWHSVRVGGCNSAFGHLSDGWRV